MALSPFQRFRQMIQAASANGSKLRGRSKAPQSTFTTTPTSALLTDLLEKIAKNPALEASSGLSTVKAVLYSDPAMKGDFAHGAACGMLLEMLRTSRARLKREGGRLPEDAMRLHETNEALFQQHCPRLQDSLPSTQTKPNR
jgi:hypothetical protein